MKCYQPSRPHPACGDVPGPGPCGPVVARAASPPCRGRSGRGRDPPGDQARRPFPVKAAGKPRATFINLSQPLTACRVSTKPSVPATRDGFQGTCEGKDSVPRTVCPSGMIRWPSEAVTLETRSGCCRPPGWSETVALGLRGANGPGGPWAQCDHGRGSRLRKGESLETSVPLGVSRGREHLVPQPPDVGW